MKYQSLLFLFVPTMIIMYMSCYRAQNAPLPDTPPAYEVMIQNFNENLKNGIVTFTSHDSTTFQVDLNFSIISGNPKNYYITCFLTGLPPGVTGASDSFTFKLNYEVTFNIFINLDTGIYPFYINVRSPMYGLETYPVRLHVLPVIDVAPSLVGTYSGSDPCGHFSLGDVWYTYSAVVATVPGHPNLVSIKNFRGMGDSIIVYASLTSMSTLDITPQTTYGYTFYGRGQGYYGLSDVNNLPWISIFGDTIVHAGDTQTCSTQLKQ